MDPIIRELEIDVLRTSSPYSKVSRDYFDNYFEMFKELPSLKSIESLLKMRYQLQSNPNIYFIDSIRYSATCLETSGFPIVMTGVCSATATSASSLSDTLRLPIHKATNVVVGFITDKTVYYEIIPRHQKHIIAIRSLK